MSESDNNDRTEQLIDTKENSNNENVTKKRTKFWKNDRVYGLEWKF